MGKLVVLLLFLVVANAATLSSFTLTRVDSSAPTIAANNIAAVPCNGRSSASATISKIFLAQTHMMTPVDNPFFFLTNDRSALLKVNVVGASSGIVSPQVSVVGAFDDKPSATFCLQGPGTLPTVISGYETTDSFLVTLPASWINTHLTSLTISVLGGSSRTYTAAQLNLSARNTHFQFVMVELLMFGVLTPKPKPVPNWNSEYFAMMPFSSITFIDFPVFVRLDKVAIGPRGDTTDKKAKLADKYTCNPACTEYAGFGIISAALDIQNNLRDANGMSPWAHGYGSISGNPGGGLGGGSGGAGDNYKGIFFHEMGHAFGLGHSGDEFNAQNYPYPGRAGTGGGVGAIWGYEQDTGLFTPTYVEKPLNTSKEKQDPMQGGDGNQRSGRTFTMFSDYNARRIYDEVAGAKYTKSGTVQTLPASMSPSDGKIYKLFDKGGRSFWKDDITPAADGSKFVTWDKTLNAYKAVPYGTSYPMTQNVPVFTVFGSYSSQTPEVRLWHSRLYYNGHYVRLIDPNTPEDWEYVRTTDYCYWGCYFFIRATYADGTTVNALIQNDKPRKPSWNDATSGGSFFRFAVNFLDKGIDLVKTELYQRPLAKIDGGVATGFPGGGAIITPSVFFAGATLLMEDTTVTASITGCRSASCSAGTYRKESCGGNFLCAACGNGGSQYQCPAGFRKNGVACDGTGSTDTQTCVPLSMCEAYGCKESETGATCTDISATSRSCKCPSPLRIIGGPYASPVTLISSTPFSGCKSLVDLATDTSSNPNNLQSYLARFIPSSSQVQVTKNGNKLVVSFTIPNSSTSALSPILNDIAEDWSSVGSLTATSDNTYEMTMDFVEPPDDVSSTKKVFASITCTVVGILLALVI